TNFTVFNGLIYFSADDGNGSNSPGNADLGRELWISDGTASGTSFVIDIRNGNSGSSPFAFFELGGTLYFSANDGGGARIWQTDGTESGTTNTNNGFSNLQPIIIGSKAYMTATTLGNALYEFDGNSFVEVPDKNGGVVEAIGGNYVELDSNTILIYMRYSPDAATVGIELYTYDISDQSYALVKDITAGDSNSGISNFTKINSTVYFEAESALWQSDGTEMGTVLVGAADSAGISSVNNFFAWNGNLYFEGDDGNGDQLWVYNPTADAVTNISNISGTANNHDPSDFVEFNGFLYYSGEDGDDNDSHLFRTNGSSVEQLDNTIADVDDLFVFNNIIYFEGDDGSTGNELFSFDPATLSTQQVTLNDSLRIFPNPSSNFINIEANQSFDFKYQIFDFNGRLVLDGVLIENQINHSLESGF
ncbi:MAG: secretion system protein Por, partial [Bacteroidota bacterium]